MNFEIPKSLYDRLNDCVPCTEYDNVRDFILSILRREIAKYNAEQDSIDLTDEDEERIKMRLKELGYL